MIDENAFGLLLSYFTVEDEEYALEREDFVKRFSVFRSAVVECLDALPLGRAARAVHLGHAVYVELTEGDQVEDPLGWLRMARARLAGRELSTVGVLTHGSRWVPEEGESVKLPAWAGDVPFLHVSFPSEPLRRALYADTATRLDEEAEVPGWGPGLYVDTEAVEALGRKLRNAPTPLRAGGATFFRVGA